MSDKSKIRVVLEFQLRETIETFDFKAIGENSHLVEVHVILQNGYSTIFTYNTSTKHFSSLTPWVKERSPVLMWCPKSDYKIEPKIK